MIPTKPVDNRHLLHYKFKPGKAVHPKGFKRHDASDQSKISSDMSGDLPFFHLGTSAQLANSGIACLARLTIETTLLS